ncbi:MAG TPA: hypothetical protein VIJ46_01305 [Rhabdochlamydiaceae bacterium]
MSLKETINHLKMHLEEVLEDLGKASRGNKAASQRVRMGTIRIAKVAKVYRKESVSAERKGGGAKKKAAKKSKKR